MKYRQEWDSNLEAIVRGFMLFLILVHENGTISNISKCIVNIIIFLLTSLHQTMPLAKDPTFLDKLFF